MFYTNIKGISLQNFFYQIAICIFVLIFFLSSTLLQLAGDFDFYVFSREDRENGG